MSYEIKYICLRRREPGSGYFTSFNRIISCAVIIAAMIFSFSCGPKQSPGRPVPHKIPNWSDHEAVEAIENMAEEYRSKGDGFWAERTYVWTGSTWVWPETIGIRSKHIMTLKSMFYKGDAATGEIVLHVILMNIPAKDLEKGGRSFLTDLVKMDTELKERRANIPPRTPYEDVIYERSPE